MSGNILNGFHFPPNVSSNLLGWSSTGHTLRNYTAQEIVALADYETMAALRAATTSIIYTSGDVVSVSSYYALSLKGGGLFQYVGTDTTTADDSGMVIVDAASRRWFRILDEAIISPYYYGAKGDGTTDDTAAFQGALTYAAQATVKGTVFAGFGQFRVKKIKAIKPSNQACEVNFIGAGKNATRFIIDAGDVTRSITGITRHATAPVVTYTGTDIFENGDHVTIIGVAGMTEVNSKTYMVANVNTTANTFELSTAYTTGTSGGTPPNDLRTAGYLVDSSAYGIYTSGGTASTTFLRIESNTAVGLKTTVGAFSVMGQGGNCGRVMSLNTLNVTATLRRAVTCYDMDFYNSDSTTDYFLEGINTTSAARPLIQDVWIRNAALSTTDYSDAALRFVPICGFDVSDCYGPNFIRCAIHGAQIGFKMHGTRDNLEGFNIQESAAVHIKRGLSRTSLSTSEEPGGYINNCHFNARDYGIYFDYVRNSIITNCIIYDSDLIDSDIQGTTGHTITGITAANPAVVTYDPGAFGDTFANGAKVGILGVVGMTQVNYRTYTVANVNTGANTFELSGVNSSAYTAYSSGGKVATYHSSVDYPSGLYVEHGGNITVTGSTFGYPSNPQGRSIWVGDARNNDQGFVIVGNSFVSASVAYQIYCTDNVFVYESSNQFTQGRRVFYVTEQHSATNPGTAPTQNNVLPVQTFGDVVEGDGRAVGYSLGDSGSVYKSYYPGFYVEGYSRANISLLTAAVAGAKQSVLFGHPSDRRARELEFDYTTNALILKSANVDKLRFPSAGGVQLIEQTAPTAPSTNEAIVYAVDDGAGATVVKAAFPTGTDVIIATQGIAAPLSGTYTPTLTNVTNMAASAAVLCQWLRVGNTVTVSGVVTVDATAAAATELGISLPVASNFSAQQNCGGVAFASAVAGMGAAILGDATNDRASMQWVAVDLASRNMYFTFTYQVI